MSCTEEWLRARVKAVWDKHPDLSYYMIISNEMLFESMLCGLFDAAQTCGIEKMSILLPARQSLPRGAAAAFIYCAVRD